MKEFEEFTKAVSLSMKALAKVIEAAADQLEEHVRRQYTSDKENEKPTAGRQKTAAQSEPTKDEAEASKTAEAPSEAVVPGGDLQKEARRRPRKSKPSKPGQPKTRQQSATQTVYLHMQAVGDVVSLDDLQKDTGFQREKLYNIVYRLKKSGKVKAVGEGLYTAV